MSKKINSKFPKRETQKDVKVGGLQKIAWIQMRETKKVRIKSIKCSDIIYPRTEQNKKNDLRKE